MMQFHSLAPSSLRASGVNEMTGKSRQSTFAKMSMGGIMAAVFAMHAPLVVAGSGAVFPPPRYYDTEGNVGASLSITYIEPTGTQSVWPLGSNEPLVFEGNIAPQGSDLQSGTLYLWLTESEVGGTYAGWAAADELFVNGSIPCIHVPIPGSTISFRMQQSDFTGGPDSSYCVVRPKIVDRMEVPSLWADWPHVEENPSRQITATIEYLEGNTLHERGSQTGTISGTGNFEGFELVWGDPDDFPTTDVPRFIFGAPVPEGPGRVSISIDGYSTDTVRLDMKNRRVHSWGAALTATASDAASASDVPIFFQPATPPLEFVVRGLTWRLSGRCLFFTNLEEHMDVNADATIDVGDLIAGGMMR